MILYTHSNRIGRNFYDLKYMLDIFSFMIPIPMLLRGFLILNLLLSPVSILLCIYLAIMGGSNSEHPSFLRSLGITIRFVYGIPLLVLAWIIGFAKCTDLIFQIQSFSAISITWMGVCIAAILFVTFGNIFIDHLYQFKKGNYSISIYAFVFTIVFVVILILVSKIPILRILL